MSDEPGEQSDDEPDAALPSRTRRAWLLALKVFAARTNQVLDSK